jgi:uncharacterized membrane protein
VFGHLMKVLHLASVAAFGGALLVTLFLADDVKQVQPGGFAAVRQAIASIGETIVLPSLIVLLLTGILLLVARPMLIGARWVWAKAAIGLAIGALAIFVVQPATRIAAAIATEAAIGTPGLVPLQRALDAEQFGVSVNLALLLAAVTLAVWRPRLGAATPRSSTGDER